MRLRVVDLVPPAGGVLLLRRGGQVDLAAVADEPHEEGQRDRLHVAHRRSAAYGVGRPDEGRPAVSVDKALQGDTSGSVVQLCF